MRDHSPEARRRRSGVILVAMLAAGIAPAAAESTPEGTSVLGVRAGSACLREEVRITGFALPREEGGASLPFDGYRISEILSAEGDTVTSGQEILRAVRQPDSGQGARPPGPESVSVRAPIAGRITRLAARVGMVTGAGAAPPPGPGGMPEPMVRIMGDAGIDLLVDVPSPYAAKIRSGATARIVRDDGPDLRGTVRVPASEVDPRTQLGRARLTLDPPNALRPGQFASAVIETARDCGLSVPRSAVTYSNGVPTVQVLNGTAVETRSIRTGLIDESNVQVREGLSDGEPVVADAGSALRAGDRVTPVISGAKAGRAR
ncbi:efflux RND transporter periplasmic adaptor subunit [uncultured Methylobacterium sp.]|uniref:efflux RND transporter periplasmic adaptor subunit n=1 Tax=uncultured Methylobacterium sp. TaxID=157278 RepID=UPI0035C976E7